MNTIERYIKVGKKTEGHGELLRGKGYEVTEQDGVLAVKCSGVREKTVDLSTPEKAKEVIGEVVAKKQVFSYTTKFIFADGKELYGVLACTRLGKISALITKGKEKVKKTSQLDDIFNAL